MNLILVKMKVFLTVKKFFLVFDIERDEKNSIVKVYLKKTESWTVIMMSLKGVKRRRMLFSQYKKKEVAEALFLYFYYIVRVVQIYWFVSKMHNSSSLQ